MASLRAVFTEAGYDRVRTVRASGNLLFAAAPSVPAPEPELLGAALERALGYPVGVYLRSAEHLAALVRRDPFGSPRPEPWTPYVTFLDRPARGVARVPLRSPLGHIEAFAVRGADVFSWCRPAGGRPGFPNEFLEGALGRTATTRNWSTVRALVEAAAPRTER